MKIVTCIRYKILNFIMKCIRCVSLARQPPNPANSDANSRKDRHQRQPKKKPEHKFNFMFFSLNEYIEHAVRKAAKLIWHKWLCVCEPGSADNKSYPSAHSYEWISSALKHNHERLETTQKS